jgi:hypothetical protein
MMKSTKKFFAFGIFDFLRGSRRGKMDEIDEVYERDGTVKKGFKVYEVVVSEDGGSFQSTGFNGTHQFCMGAMSAIRIQEMKSGMPSRERYTIEEVEEK